MMARPTQKERSAIGQLEAIAKTWPDSLWLFSASGRLCVMQKRDGERVMTSLDGADPDYCLATIDIENDGGDW